MSRDPRPNRSGAGAYPPPTRRYEEYEDDYPPTSRYYSQDLPDNSDRGSDQRRRGYSPGLSTNTSSGSSLLERMKVRSYDTSSRTSLDGDHDNKPRQPTAPTWARKPSATPIRQQIREEPQEVAQAPDSGSAGSTLWGRVVSAAGSLTINVTGAWSSGASDGPETPPGGETRLTRAMKQYYIERARSPLDLPHWLFEEHERNPTGPRNPQRGARRYQEEEQEEVYTPPAPQRGALRDVYDKAASRQQPRSTPTLQPTRSTPAYTSPHGGEHSPTESKAATRLRALRDAKRMQQGVGVTTNGAPLYTPSRYDEEYGNGGERRSMDPSSDAERRQPARVGLPGRPGGRYNS